MSQEIPHDLFDYLRSASSDMHDEYNRIFKRATEDPGTAGDQGEENWATLLRNWLPSYFQVVTKGRILFENGEASPQLDVLVLSPSYPGILIDKKMYLSAGVVAAFECKTTVKAKHIENAVKTAALIRERLSHPLGSYYKELVPKMIFGLLAHSHSWKAPTSKPIHNINKRLIAANRDYVSEPIQTIDFITVADLATWRPIKISRIIPPNVDDIHPNDRPAATAFLIFENEIEHSTHIFGSIGTLLAGMLSRLSWDFPDMRGISSYFSKVNRQVASEHHHDLRIWPADEVYSEETKTFIPRNLQGRLGLYSEWAPFFI